MGVVAGVDEAEQTPPAAAQTQQASEQAGQQAPESEPSAEQSPQTPGFGERGRMRRRARFLRKARELAYRDLGGLVFDLHRFGQRNDQLVLAKLAALRHIDTEVRELEAVLGDRRPITVLREVGIAACPRCAAIHGSDDRFCPGCGLAFDANADRPISTAPVGAQVQAPASQSAPSPSTPPAQSAPPTQSTPPSLGTSFGRSQPQPAQSPPPIQGPPAQDPPTPARNTPPALGQTPAQGTSAPKIEPISPLKPVRAPLANNSATPGSSPDSNKPAPADEEEPTRILRPPNGGTGA